MQVPSASRNEASHNHWIFYSKGKDMSHFSVLVVGDHPERLLAPFHEFECTGINDEWVQDIDITEEVRNTAKKRNISMREAANDNYNITDEDIVTSENEIKPYDTHKYGYAIADEKGEIIKVVRRTNPNAKWDWYRIGGRWQGFFKLKEGKEGNLGEKSFFDKDSQYDPNYCDQAIKGNIDFADMREEVRKKAEENWREMRSFCLKKDWYLNDLDFPSKEEYIKRKVDRAIAPYAYIKDGEWHSQGEMGWFGISKIIVSERAWNAHVNEMIDSLPDDTLLTLVDCHI